jgi:ribosomal protein L37AE/L43A
MRQFLKDIASRTAAQIISQWLLPPLLSIAILAIPTFRSWIDTLVPLPIQGRLAAVFFVLFCASVAYAIQLYRRLSPERMAANFHGQFKEFHVTLGIWSHKRKSVYFCPSCKSKQIESPLREESAGWRCMVRECDMFFENPEWKEKQFSLLKSKRLPSPEEIERAIRESRQKKDT